MQLFNQNKVSMDSLSVTDYLPNGFKFVNATNCGQYNEGWLATDPLNPVYQWKGNISPVQALPLTAATGSGGVSSLSIVNYDPGCGSNRLLLLGIAVGNNGTSGTPPTVTAVTFGGNRLRSWGHGQRWIWGRRKQCQGVYISSCQSDRHWKY